MTRHEARLSHGVLDSRLPSRCASVLGKTMIRLTIALTRKVMRKRWISNEASGCCSDICLVIYRYVCWAFEKCMSRTVLVARNLAHASLADFRRDLPDFVSRSEDGVPEARVDRLPAPDDVSIPVQTNLIIELCSK